MKLPNGKIGSFVNLFDLLNKHTVYYKEIIDKSGYSIDDFTSTDDICRLPVLTKEIIRQRYSDIVPDNITKIPHSLEFVSASLRRFASIFCRQNSAFCFGQVACSGHPCQKHPSTKTAILKPGNATSATRRGFFMTS